MPETLVWIPLPICKTKILNRWSQRSFSVLKNLQFNLHTHKGNKYLISTSSVFPRLASLLCSPALNHQRLGMLCRTCWPHGLARSLQNIITCRQKQEKPLSAHVTNPYTANFMSAKHSEVPESREHSRSVTAWVPQYGSRNQMRKRCFASSAHLLRTCPKKKHSL